MEQEAIQLLRMDDQHPRIGIFPLSDLLLSEPLAEAIAVPHRHDHYCCFFIESGHLNFTVDFRNLDIHGPSLLVSTPGQVHQPVSSQDLLGWVLAFDPRFADEHARSVIEQSFAHVVLLTLDPAAQEWFSGMFRLIHAAAAETETGFQQQLRQSLINAFFFRIAALHQQQEDSRIREYPSRNVEIAKTFHQLVKAHFYTLKKPADYASKMSITVSYLNDTVKSVTGFSSTWLIQHEIFSEAQRLLFYTSQSVKEIATTLGYDDHKYFIRLFSKNTGTSPARFREKNRP